MKISIKIAAAVLAASIVALVGVIAYVTLGRALGQNWSSFDGPEPVWPAVVGFGTHMTNVSVLTQVWTFSMTSDHEVAEVEIFRGCGLSQSILDSSEQPAQSAPRNEKERPICIGSLLFRMGR